MDSGESLDSRMERLQRTFTEIFETKQVNEIKLYINSGYGSLEMLKASGNNLKNEILGIYERNNNFMVYVQIDISK